MLESWERTVMRSLRPSQGCRWLADGDCHAWLCVTLPVSVPALDGQTGIRTSRYCRSQLSLLKPVKRATDHQMHPNLRAQTGQQPVNSCVNESAFAQPND